jgi:hypothetical protein
MLDTALASPGVSGCDPPTPSRLTRSKPLAPRLSTDSNAEQAVALEANGLSSHLLEPEEEAERRTAPFVQPPPREEDMEPTRKRAGDVSPVGRGTNCSPLSLVRGCCCQ